MKKILKEEGFAWLLYVTIYFGIYLGARDPQFGFLSFMPACILLAVVLADWQINRVKITHFKQMVKKLHDGGIEVAEVENRRMTFEQYQQRTVELRTAERTFKVMTTVFKDFTDKIL